MISIKTSAKINRPIETVANYVFDLKNSKKWYKNFLYADLLVSNPLRQGAKLFVQKKILGNEILTMCKVLECEKGRKLKIKSGYFMKFETTFFLECMGSSQTRIIIRNKSKLNVFFMPIRPFTKLFVKINSRSKLSNLKSILEQKN